MKQEHAFNILASGGNVFLTGSAGAGKTHLLNRYIRHLRAREAAVAVTASTGIAATHIGGVTIHSWSGLGVRDALSDDDLIDIARKRPVRNRVSGAGVLIIDEISMLSAQTLQLVDQLMRRLRNNPRPFGGVQVVFCGDFFQLPPVSRGQTPAQLAFMAPVWKQAELRVCYLDESHRHGDDALSLLLGEIRSGEVSETCALRLEQKMRDSDGRAHENTLKLHTHNADVDAANARKLRELPGAVTSFDAVTAGSANLVESLKRFVMAPEHLQLKQQAQVMFVRNNPSGNYLNGTLGVVTGFNDDGLPVVKTFDGDSIVARPEEWNVLNEHGETLASYIQVPLRLAWAITVHKSQGMTLDRARVDLSKTFELGQGYVAFSRVKTWDGLQLSGYNARALQVDSLVLKADRRFRELSAQAQAEFDALSAAHLARAGDRHVIKCGGTTDPKIIQQNERRLAGEAGKPVRKARSETLEKSKALIEAGCDLEEIMARRKFAKGTIISHLEKLREIHPDLDLSRFKPRPETLEAVCAAIARCREKAGDEDLDKHGRVKLTPLFLELNRKYNYEEIHLARLFCADENSPPAKTA